MEPRIQQKEIDEAVRILARSERGLVAMKHLHTLLNNGAAALDASSQWAVMMLITAGFDGKCGTTLDLISYALHSEDTRP